MEDNEIIAFYRNGMEYWLLYKSKTKNIYKYDIHKNKNLKIQALVLIASPILLYLNKYFTPYYKQIHTFLSDIMLLVLGFIVGFIFSIKIYKYSMKKDEEMISQSILVKLEKEEVDKYINMGHKDLYYLQIPIVVGTFVLASIMNMLFITNSYIILIIMSPVLSRVAV